MEPMDIDWKNIESIFVVDDKYEHINAPKWIDFSAPERFIDDEAWFCKPDCRHPKNADDFRRSPLVSKVKNLRSATNSEVVPLGARNRRDTNLKRRGILSSTPSISSQTDMKPKASKKNFRDDGENENPNHNFPQSPLHDPIINKKTTKSAIKSSTEKSKTKKKKAFDSIADPISQEQRPPGLKSSLSARNLFAGRDILNQISDFCSELKRLALNGGERGSSEKSEEPLIDVETQISVEIEEMRKKEKQRKALSSKIFSPDAWRKKRSAEQNRVSLDLKEDGCKGDQGFLPVRSCPPSPQRFPSPSTFQKPTRITPLKPPKSRTTERGSLQELERDNTKTMKESVDEDENKISVSGSDGKSLDVFWFLKPCTYLGK